MVGYLKNGVFLVDPGSDLSGTGVIPKEHPIFVSLISFFAFISHPMMGVASTGTGAKRLFSLFFLM